MLVGVATAVATGKFKDMLHEHSLPLCRTLKCKVGCAQCKTVVQRLRTTRGDEVSQIREPGLRAICFTS